MDAAMCDLLDEKLNLETYSLVWLDKSVNESKDNRQAQTRLRSAINHLLTFEDEQACVNHLEAVSADDQVILIVSGQLGQIVVPKIVELQPILAIYVYCFRRDAYEAWARTYSKVRGVFTQLDDLIREIRDDQKVRSRLKLNEKLSIDILDLQQTSEGKSTIDLNGEFLQFLLLIDCLVRMPSNNIDESKLIALCKRQYEGNDSEMEFLFDFRNNYLPERAVWWYTENSFLYRMLNKALRKQNIELLHIIRFFIHDLEAQLKKANSNEALRVYRAQMMSTNEVKRLQQAVGEIIAMRSFFSASRTRQCANKFFGMADAADDCVQVLFEIDADPRIAGVRAFRDISTSSRYPQEEEVLFMIGSIFKLDEIILESDGVWVCHLTLCSFADEKLKELFDYMKSRLGEGEATLLELAQICNNMDQVDLAERYLNRRLKELPANDRRASACHLQLGDIEQQRGNYPKSLVCYTNSLELLSRTACANDTRMAATHNAMAMIYSKQKDYEKALRSYGEALLIYTNKHGQEHPNVALCLNNMANVYRKQGKLDDALQMHEKALTMRKECLPAAHPHIASSHNNIGILQQSLGQHYEAAENLQAALHIYTKSQIARHDTASVLKNLGLVYHDMGLPYVASNYYNGAADIYRQLYGPTDPEVMRLERQIRGLAEDSA